MTNWQPPASDPGALRPEPPGGGGDHWSYQPTHVVPQPTRLDRPPRNQRHHLGMVLSTTLLIVGLSGGVILAANLLDGSFPAPVIQPSIQPAPGLTPPPTVEPNPTSEPVKDGQETLTANPIYQLKVTAHCPSQTVPSNQKVFKAQVRELVDCHDQAWQTALEGTGIEFQAPEVEFYSKTVDTPCGKLGSKFPASYCAANQTMYLGKAAFTQSGFYRLATAELVSHEYAHHVQSLSGILGHSRGLEEDTNLTSRRIELQAHCLASYSLTHSGFGFNDSDRNDLEYQFGYTNDAEGHGSVKAERYWGRRGLDAKTLGACNTWKVKASKVK